MKWRYFITGKFVDKSRLILLLFEVLEQFSRHVFANPRSDSHVAIQQSGQLILIFNAGFDRAPNESQAESLHEEVDVERFLKSDESGQEISATPKAQNHLYRQWLSLDVLLSVADDGETGEAYGAYE